MYTVSFDEYTESLAPLVGGKCASLGAMTKAGLPVPPGFMVSIQGYNASIGRDSDLHEHLLAVMHDVDVHDLAQLAAKANEARQFVMDAGPSVEVEAAIRARYDELCERTGIADVPVAVRSSATAEDQPDASFAGQQDTYLWVRGGDEVVFHVVKCWASLFTDRAIAYRTEHGYSNEDVAMAVAVQQMVDPKSAGVAFTIDPTNGDRSKIVIDSSFGLGETVVSGLVTPDNFSVDKVVFEIVKRTISAKECECVPGNEGVVHRDLEPERSTEPSLSDAEVKEVARLARQCGRHFGRPQDTEWAIDRQGQVFLLQSRPETVWSNKPRQTTGAATGMDGILKTLMTPTRVRPAAD